MTASDRSTIAELLAVMEDLLRSLPPEQRAVADFLHTYRRTTVAVAQAIGAGAFDDPAWVERWDLAFADLYLLALDAHVSDDGHEPSRPWQLAFAAGPDLPPLLNVLLGINAHINYDLPQALLAVISDEEFRDPARLDRRRRDHERIDEILARRVADEDRELSAVSVLRVRDRLLRPLNRWASRRFLQEARAKVWLNTLELWRAKAISENAYAARLAELEVLSAAKNAQILTPGPVLLRLAVGGFGVRLPPAQ